MNNMSTHTWRSISEKVGHLGDQLFHQQCWLWGCDVRRPEGNALLMHGFTRHRPPDGAKGSSAYLLSITPETTLILWAFGMFYGSPTAGGIYLGRYDFRPTVVSMLDIHIPPWRPDQVTLYTQPVAPTHDERVQMQFTAVLHWIIDYETWILATFGLEYRHQCVTSWTKGHLMFPADQIIEEWSRFITHMIAS